MPETSSTPPLQWMRAALFWLMPPLLLFVLVRHIDFARLQQAWQAMDASLALLALLSSPLVVLVGAWRWRQALGDLAGLRPPWAAVLRHYWSGLALGFVTPGQLGADVYRLSVAGLQSRRLGAVALGLLLEKVMALLSAVLLIAVLLPQSGGVLPGGTPAFAGSLSLAGWLVPMALGSLLLVFILHRGLVARLWQALVERSQRLVERARDAADQRGWTGAAPFAFVDAARPVSRWRAALHALLLSLLIQGTSSLGVWLAFMALGYTLPWLQVLCITPLVFFALLLPVSVAGIGVREALYVGLYGGLGVPAEAALLAAFVALLGTLANGILGGLLMASATLRSSR